MHTRTLPSRSATDPPNAVGTLRESHLRIGVCVQEFEELLNLAPRCGGGAPLRARLREFERIVALHTADEEESLFPRLRGLDVPGSGRTFALLESLEQEHECAHLAQAEIRRIAARWPAEETLSPDAALRLSTVLRQVAALYRHHMAAEEHSLFPLAATALPAADLAAVAAEMAARRGRARLQP